MNTVIVIKFYTAEGRVMFVQVTRARRILV